ncbi:hypothetical protein Patl1_30112 [Pistacia atlantica]|uniref:Uncharacterized protein n=1 Tax=Pistacia atlantica TaxID=434234 RepID=A0ACC1ABI4_9ROSI|nr:hypothetical protein Patl1_30112 [Pistacia atlantica]
MPHRNIFSWNIILREFSRSNFPHKSLQLFHHMWEQSNVRPNDFTLPLVLRACAILGDLKLGLSVHGLCHKLGFERSLFVASALVFFYVTFGRIFYAREVFDEMPDKDSVLWTAMLAGYAQHAEPILALQVFREMVGSEVQLDDVVMVSLLLASLLGAVLGGCRVHNDIVIGERIARKLIRLQPEKAGYYVLLSNMYAAAGRFDEAEKVRILLKERNVSKDLAATPILNSELLSKEGGLSKEISRKVEILSLFD